MDLSYEDQIILERPLDDLAYVRESPVLVRGRTKRPNIPGLVGYTTLKKDAPHEPGMPSFFRIRAFWLHDNDPYQQGFPAEAVDPLSVRPGKPSAPPKADRFLSGLPEPEPLTADELARIVLREPAPKQVVRRRNKRGQTLPDSERELLAKLDAIELVKTLLLATTTDPTIVVASGKASPALRATCLQLIDDTYEQVEHLDALRRELLNAWFAERNFTPAAREKNS